MHLSNMHITGHARHRTRACTAAAIAAMLVCARVTAAQDPRPPSDGRALTLAAALSEALRTSPDIAVAREAASRARGLERQAGARANPSLSYNREQVGSGSTGSQQDILEVEQPLEIGGARGARVEAARFRREAAEARARFVEVQVAYEVTVAFANALAAERRAALTTRLAEIFSSGERVASRRLAAGDISGFATRRIRLEATRYSVQTAEAQLVSRAARLSLFALIPETQAGSPLEFAIESIRPPVPLAADDSLPTLALARRPDLAAIALEGRAAMAEASLARRERTPIPTVAVGGKREAFGGGSSESGFVVGLRVPLPLWDRRAGNIQASDADVRGAAAELRAATIRARREVSEAADALRTVGQQLELLTPQVSDDAMATLRSAQVAYAEGDISLVEWLDAARAYHEVETSLADLRSEYLIRVARLHRALGTTLVEQTK